MRAEPKASVKETEPTPAPSSRIAVMTRDVVPGKNTRRGGKHVGLCMVGPAQVKIVEAWTQDGKINYGTIDPSKVGTR